MKEVVEVVWQERYKNRRSKAKEEGKVRLGDLDELTSAASEFSGQDSDDDTDEFM